jgi:hypothetical protein
MRGNVYKLNVQVILDPQAGVLMHDDCPKAMRLYATH